jgi:hypothetical protein
MGRKPLFDLPEHLQWKGVKPKMMRAYCKALHHFFLHLRTKKARVPGSIPALDKALASYMNHMYMEGEPIGYAGHLLSAIKRFYPPCRNFLFRSRQWHNNWQREYVPTRAKPFPWLMVRGIVATALLDQDQAFAFVTLLAYRRFLRTNEFLSLRCSDIAKFDTKTLVISLINTKTSGSFDESVTVDDMFLAKWHRNLLQTREPDELIFSEGAAAYNEKLQSYLQLLRVTDKYTPYSLRRGGATQFYMRTRSLDQTKIVGRWRDQRTCRIYLDEANGMIKASSLPLQVRRRCRKVIKLLLK